MSNTEKFDPENIEVFIGDQSYGLVSEQDSSPLVYTRKDNNTFEDKDVAMRRIYQTYVDFAYEVYYKDFLDRMLNSESTMEDYYHVCTQVIKMLEETFGERMVGKVGVDYDVYLEEPQYDRMVNLKVVLI